MWRTTIWTTHWNPVVRVVEDDLHIGGDDAGTCSLVEERLALLWPQVGELIAQHELDGCKTEGSD